MALIKSCLASGGGIDFSDLAFDTEITVNAGASQALTTGHCYLIIVTSGNSVVASDVFTGTDVTTKSFLSKQVGSTFIDTALVYAGSGSPSITASYAFNLLVIPITTD